MHPVSRLSYGWIIVAVSATANSLAWSVRSTFALFYVALLAEFGWQRGQAALGYSLSWLLLIVFSPLAGWLYDRFGARVVVPAGGLLLGAGMALTGRVHALWEYYLAFGVLSAAGIALIMMPAFAVTSRWFVTHRGTALGIISAGASASAVIFYPVNAWLIGALGWRHAMAAYGVIIVLGVVPAAALLYRRAPADARRPSHGAPGPAVQPVSTEPAGPAETEWTLLGALGTSRLWAAFAMWGLGVIGYQIMTTHQVAHALDRGFDAATVAWVFGLSGLFTTVGNLVGGALSDRWGRARVFALGSLIGVTGIVCFAQLGARDDLARLLAYAGAGFGFGMRISLLSAIPADLFQGRNFGAILGFVNAGGGLGGFIGPFLGGYLFDLRGDYQLAFTVSALAIVGSAVAAWVAARRPAGVHQ
jgi:MFS family permease